MTSLPPRSLLVGAVRWLREIESSSVERAWTALTTQPRYGDLTATQYSAALGWLRSTGCLTGGDRPATLVLETAIVASQPSWLPDADDLIRSPDELPLDVVDVAAALGIGPRECFSIVTAASGKVDTAVRERVGALGEEAVVSLFERDVACRVRHDAAAQDGLGYDVTVETDTSTLHVEVKATTRRGRLRFFLSRNEYSVMLTDNAWRLVVVLLPDPLVSRVCALATVSTSWIRENAPVDGPGTARWESARFAVPAGALVPGVPELVPHLTGPVESSVVAMGCADPSPPGWLSGPPA